MFFVWLCLVVLRGTETKTEKKGLTEGSLSLSLSLCLSVSLSLSLSLSPPKKPHSDYSVFPPERACLVAFRLFLSRPRALGPFRARRIQQSLPERAFSGV